MTRRDARGWAFPAFALVLLAACGPGLRPLPPATVPSPVSRPANTVVLPNRPASPGVLSAGVSEVDLDALWTRQLMVPVSGVEPAQLRDDYEARRGTRAHLALDMPAPKGTAVVAADDGRIGRLGATPAGGNIIYALDSDDRFVYYYAHLDRHARGLSVGDRVRKGDLLGYVGTTGNAPSNTPHLHFQVMRKAAGSAWWDGPPINPWAFFVYSGAPNR